MLARITSPKSKMIQTLTINIRNGDKCSKQTLNLNRRKKIMHDVKESFFFINIKQGFVYELKKKTLLE